MAEKGWISIHRKIRECFIWEDKPFAMGQAWIDLLLSANHETKNVLFDKKLVEIQKGQLLTSVRKLSERWGWSPKKVMRFLNLLETDKMLVKNSNNRATLLTLVNYGVYQGDGNSLDNTEETLTTTQRKQSRHTNNNDNNGNNVNKERVKSRNFSPPSIDEVREYCLSRNNGIDPENFVDFYESKGWMVGSNKMKDWKAAVRTWEQRNKKDNKVPERSQEEDGEDYAKWVKETFGAYAD